METTDRRSLLEAIARAPETGDMARLKALELLERLDERERTWLPDPPDSAEELADDPERLSRMIEQAFEHGLFDDVPGFQRAVDRKARALLEEREEEALDRRASIAVLGAQETEDAPGNEDEGQETEEPEQAVSEAENTSTVHPLDAVTFRHLAGDDSPAHERSQLTRWRK